MHSTTYTTLVVATAASHNIEARNHIHRIETAQIIEMKLTDNSNYEMCHLEHNVSTYDKIVISRVSPGDVRRGVLADREPAWAARQH
eukprot:5745981-Amphidinium_carterae.1